MQTVWWQAAAYKLSCTHNAVPSELEEFRNLEYWKGKTLRCNFCGEDKEVVGWTIVSEPYRYEILQYAKINQKP